MTLIYRSLEPDTCPVGYFGDLCYYQCHCADTVTGCDRTTGVCNSRMCAEGWGGDDCQQGIVQNVFIQKR